MPNTPLEVLKNLKDNQFKPIYFLQGEEPFFIDQISNYIEEHALTEAEKGFNQTILYGKESSMAEILTHARRFPMMAEKQVVIVKEAQEISDIKKESGQKLLENYLNNPVPTTILAFCHKHKSLDRRKSITKIIEKHAVFINTKKLYDNQLPDWIQSHIKGLGYTITPKATYMLAQNIGNNLERINNEINKISINLHNEESEINETIIEEFVGISKEYNLFEFQNAIIQRDGFKAYQMVNYFGANPKQSPMVLVTANLYSLFSKLLIVHQEGAQSSSLLAKLKVNPYFVKDYVQGAGNYSLSKVLENINHLRKADNQSKGIDSPSLKEHAILKELVYNLMN